MHTALHDSRRKSHITCWATETIGNYNPLVRKPIEGFSLYFKQSLVHYRTHLGCASIYMILCGILKVIRMAHFPEIPVTNV